MAGDALPLLSKSRYTAGLQCSRKLYLSCFQPELGTPPDAAQQSVFDTGSLVGEIARDLRPGGVLVDEPYYLHDDAVERTPQAAVGQVTECRLYGPLLGADSDRSGEHDHD